MVERADRKVDVLLADNNLAYAKMLADSLAENGLCVEISKPKDTLEILPTTNPDLLVHGSLHKTDISRLIREAQQKISGLPVVILAGTVEQGKLGPLEVTQTINKGAAHCLYKYTNPVVMAAYLRAIIRRGSEKASLIKNMQSKDLRINFQNRVIMKQDQPLYLSPTEWELLTVLSSKPDYVMLFDEIISKVWGPEYRGDLFYLREGISRLRKKLGDNAKDPQIIMTIRDIGYMLIGEPIYQN